MSDMLNISLHRHIVNAKHTRIPPWGWIYCPPSVKNFVKDQLDRQTDRHWRHCLLSYSSALPRSTEWVCIWAILHEMRNNGLPVLLLLLRRLFLLTFANLSSCSNSSKNALLMLHSIPCQPSIHHRRRDDEGHVVALVAVFYCSACFPS